MRVGGVSVTLCVAAGVRIGLWDTDSKNLSKGTRFTSFTTSRPLSSDAMDATFLVTADAQWMASPGPSPFEE